MSIWSEVRRLATERHRETGRIGMIVPLSLGFSGDFATLRKLILLRYSTNWFSSFGRIPSALFNYDVRVRNIIHLGSRDTVRSRQHSTRLHRWFDEARPQLFESLEYAEFDAPIWNHQIPKIGLPRLSRAIEKLLRSELPKLKTIIKSNSAVAQLYFKKTAYNWLAFTRDVPPCFGSNGKPIEHTQVDSLPIADKTDGSMLYLLLNGKYVFLFWCIVGDDFHVTKTSIDDFPVPNRNIEQDNLAKLKVLASSLEKEVKCAVSFKLNAGKRVGNYNMAMCRSTTDKSDQLLAPYLGLDEAWDDIELFYSQMVKTDFDDNED